MTYLIHSVVEGFDYVFLSRSVMFSPTSSTSVMQTAQVQIVDDMALEGDHSFTVTIADVEPAMVSTGTASVPVTILDNDGTSAYVLLTSHSLTVVNFTAADQATVAMALSAVSVQEDEGSTMFCANLTLTSGYTLETVIIAPFDVFDEITG